MFKGSLIESPCDFHIRRWKPSIRSQAMQPWLLTDKQKFEGIPKIDSVNLLVLFIGEYGYPDSLIPVGSSPIELLEVAHLRNRQVMLLLLLFLRLL